MKQCEFARNCQDFSGGRPLCLNNKLARAYCEDNAVLRAGK